MENPLSDVIKQSGPVSVAIYYSALKQMFSYFANMQDSCFTLNNALSHNPNSGLHQVMAETVESLSLNPADSSTWRHEFCRVHNPKTQT